MADVITKPMAEPIGITIIGSGGTFQANVSFVALVVTCDNPPAIAVLLA